MTDNLEKNVFPIENFVTATQKLNELKENLRLAGDPMLIKKCQEEAVNILQQNPDIEQLSLTRDFALVFYSRDGKEQKIQNLSLKSNKTELFNPEVYDHQKLIIKIRITIKINGDTFSLLVPDSPRGIEKKIRDLLYRIRKGEISSKKIKPDTIQTIESKQEEANIIIIGATKDEIPRSFELLKSISEGNRIELGITKNAIVVTIENYRGSIQISKMMKLPPTENPDETIEGLLEEALGDMENIFDQFPDNGDPDTGFIKE